MEVFNQSLGKLTTLLTLGAITQVEYNTRRKKLVDDFIGKPAASGFTASPAVRRPSLPYAGARPYGAPRRASLGPISTVPRGRPFGASPWAFGGRGFGAGAGAMAYQQPTYQQPAYGGPMRSFAPGPIRGRGGKGLGLAPRGPYTNPGAVRFSPYPYPRGRSRVGSTAVKIQPIPDGTSVEELTAVFMVYGAVLLAVIKEGTPRHAFVNFTTAEEASAAAANGAVQLQGQLCHVALSGRKRPPVPEGAPTNGIGIFNMPFTMSQDEVSAMISQYPGFQNMKYVTNKMGEFRGYVFAYFDSVESATYAKQLLLGMNIGEQVLDVKYSNRSAEEAFQDKVQQ